MRCKRLVNRLHHHSPSPSSLSSQRRDRLWNSMYAHHLRQTDRLFRIHVHKSAFFLLLSRNSFRKHLFNFDFYYVDFRRNRGNHSKNSVTSNSMPAKTFTIKRFIFRISNDFLDTTINSFEIIFDWFLTRCDSIWIFCAVSLASGRGSIKSLVKSVSFDFFI